MTLRTWAARCLSISTAADSVISFAALTNTEKVAETYIGEEEQENKTVLPIASTEIIVVLSLTQEHIFELWTHAQTQCPQKSPQPKPG